MQGEDIDRELFILPPKEANTCNVWRLKKCPYGLVDASRKWYNKVKSVLLSLNLKMSRGDPSIFYYYKDDKLAGIIAIHVDDFLWAGDLLFSNNIISAFCKVFTIGKTSKNTFRYLGLDLNQNCESITLDQIHYIQSLQSLSKELINNRNSVSDIIQSAVGKLLWVCGQTRPDISFEVGQLATNIKNSDETSMKIVNKLFTNMKQNECKLIYKKLGNDNDLRIVVYSDAAHGNLSNGGSQGGYIIFLCGHENNCVPLNWQSKRIRRVVRSSLAAETLALSDALDDAVYMMKLFSEIMFNNYYKIPIEIVIDNKSLYESLFSKKNVIEKCLRIDIAFIKENIDSKIVSKVHLVSSRNQLANVLTKKGASPIELLNVIKSGIIHI